jgi:osmotically-inducible protein OsmY
MKHYPAAVLPTPEIRRVSASEASIEIDRLVVSVERAVWLATGGAVRDLCVEVSRNGVLLRGRCGTYYTKQKAQHAAMGVACGRTLANRIDVDS